MIKIYKCTFVFFLLAFPVYSQDMQIIKDIEKACNVHKKRIKTGKGKVFHHSTSFRYKKPIQEKGEWIYKDDHWRYDYQGVTRDLAKKSNGSEVYKVEFENELLGDNLLRFERKKRCGSIVENLTPNRIRGLYFIGITGYNVFGDGISHIIEEMLEKGYGTFDSVKEENFKGKPCQILNFTILDENKKPKYLSKIVVSPSQQYSYLYYERSRIDTGVIVEKDEIDMEYIESAKIWFPKQAVFQRRPNPENPNEFQTVDKFIFKHTQLNIPISEEDLAIQIPKGCVINNEINRDIYHLDVDADMEGILSGAVKSDMEKEKVPITERNIGTSVIQKLKKSIILKIVFLVLLFLIISFSLLRITKRKDVS